LKWNKPSLAGILAGGDGPARKKRGIMVLTDGVFTALVKRRLGTGKTREQQTFKLCALAGMWTGRWSLQETILAQSKRMIQLSPVGLGVLYAVDYTKVITLTNRSYWTSTQ
jgi:hypothetical protein